MSIPDVLRRPDGTRITTKEEWEAERGRIRDAVLREEYGFPPPPPEKVEARVENAFDGGFAGKARIEKLSIEVKTGNGSFAFPVTGIIPRTQRPPMAFVYICFDDSGWLLAPPVEELVDRGFALFAVKYTDVSSDDGDFTSGLAALFPELQDRGPETCGKLGLWAWAMSRVLDCLETRRDIDTRNIAATGHSRLGKTAVLAAALDDRFRFALPVNSGCSGVSVFRSELGEDVEHIASAFPYWFCGNFQRYRKNEEGMPFEQYWLLSLVAPRPLYSSTAEEDPWAAPPDELESCRLVTPVYELYGKKGLVVPESGTELEKPLMDGTVGWHVRRGGHFFGRYDWQRLMEFMEKNRAE